MNLTAEIVNRIFNIFELPFTRDGLISQEFLISNSIISILEDKSRIENYGYGAILNCLDLSLNMMFWDLSFLNESYYLLLIQEKDNSIYFLHYINNMGKIYLLDSSIKEATMLAQANLLAGFEKINNLYYTWKKIDDSKIKILRQKSIDFINSI